MTDKVASTELTYRQRKGIAALLSHRTESEAAAAVGVRLRTISRWLALPAFRDELKRASKALTSEVVSKTMTRLTEGQTAALDVLEDVMSKGKPNERRQAAATWLTTWLDMTQVIDFSERLDRLEGELKP